MNRAASLTRPPDARALNIDGALGVHNPEVGEVIRLHQSHGGRWRQCYAEFVLPFSGILKGLSAHASLTATSGFAELLTRCPSLRKTERPRQTLCWHGVRNRREHG